VAGDGQPSFQARRGKRRYRPALQDRSHRNPINTAIRLIALERRSPEYLAQYLKNDIAKWAAPIKSSGITAD
jgi:hypothetical protein